MHCKSIALSGLLSLGLMLALSSSAPAGDPHSAYYDQRNDQILWFMQTSDTHIGVSGTDDSSNLSWLVNDARLAINPGFILVTGDLTDSTNGNIFGYPNGPYQAEWDEYQRIVNVQGITSDNYFDIPGNHDAYNDKYFAYYLANSVQGRAKGRTQASFIRTLGTEKYHFLGINTADNTGKSFSIFWPYGDYAGLDSSELAFISDEMTANPDSTLTLVFGHHPLEDTGKSSDTYVYYGLPEFLTLMNGSRTSLYGYGHTHASGQDFFVPGSRLAGYDGFFYFNVSSLGKATQDQYTIMAIDCNGLSARIFDIRNWPAVMITAPLDENLGVSNPYTYTVPAGPANPIRALVFDPGIVNSVQYHIDGSSAWYGMSPVAGNPHLWEALWNASSLAQGPHTIEVKAATASGTRYDSIAVTVESVAPPSPAIKALSTIVGKYVTNRKTGVRTFQATSMLKAGDAVIFRVGLDPQVSNATVRIKIEGPNSATYEVISSPSVSGTAEAVWQTRASSKRQTGTPAGSYKATVTGVTATGYTWDGQSSSVSFTLQ